jgi:tetratricopeptide (TPR) repeat protein
MRRTWIFLASLLVVATTAQAQIGKNVLVVANTPEDKALGEIYNAPDGPGKIALLDKFMADYGKGDLELLGDQLYVNTYLAQKNYGKVLEYGQKALALDPDNFSTAVNMVHAADEMGDTSKLFDAGEQVAAILARYKVAPAPAGTSERSWGSIKAENIASSAQDIKYVEYALFDAAYKTANPAAKAALMERYATTFPDSTDTANARETAAFAYQQAQQYPKMLETAQKVLAGDPDNATMMVLLADYWSEKGQAAQLDKAGEYAQKALDLLGQAKKPEGVSDDQWKQQITLRKGLAYSSLGQVFANSGKNTEAVNAFKQANPLLKSNATSYGRNLYRLGFTLAKMKQIPEARTVLTEAVSIDSPYKALAQQTLDKIGGAVAAGTRKSKS